MNYIQRKKFIEIQRLIYVRRRSIEYQKKKKHVKSGKRKEEKSTSTVPNRVW